MHNCNCTHHLSRKPLIDRGSSLVLVISSQDASFEGGLWDASCLLRETPSSLKEKEHPGNLQGNLPSAVLGCKSKAPWVSLALRICSSSPFTELSSNTNLSTINDETLCKYWSLATFLWRCRSSGNGHLTGWLDLSVEPSSVIAAAITLAWITSTKKSLSAR